MSFEIYGLNKKICEDIDSLKKEVWTNTLEIMRQVDSIKELIEKTESPTEHLKMVDIKKGMQSNLQVIQNCAEHLKGYSGAIK